jgi:hypothetical protein
MPGRIGSSWELLKNCLTVIRKDKELLMFPIFSGILMILIGLTFVGSIFFAGFSEHLLLIIVLLFIMYLVLYFIGIYFNTAIIGCATIRLDGGNPTIKDGFRIANKNLRAIVGWALIAATVGIILSAIRERAGILGQIVTSLIGFAWTMAAFFVIPVYIYENLPVSKAIKRSAHVFKDTWGETFIGYFGLGLILVPLALIGLIPIAVGFYVDGLLVGFVIALLYWIIIACLGIAAQGVLKASLYRYAITGKVSADIVPERLLKPRT